ncbi:PREDICTED: probable RNA-binding protein 46 [Ceratosolen solmsi marchali]|uniref:Probable RNA-binding protein 46 n=1 Tax=Ceratosolen solmsi marchali TaxID=326594 RepID=A0AAJ6VK82_9HYME|nr:PREDICTED: probable RNA-binding protein 46 [Ceratosolen solmsi marchali]
MSEYRRGSVSTIASSTSDTLSTVSSDCQVTVRLLDLMYKTQYELVQENGQRRLTAPELTKEQRERIKGAEIFLGRLPRDCYEDELMPILEKAGRLLELRLMLDFSGTTRGYAFALYTDAKIARKACLMLDGYEIRPGHPIGAVKSVDNCRLFFGGVPKNKTKEEFLEELSKLMEGIVNIYLYPNAQDRSLNRGFIFVEFKDHRSAAMARRKLIPGRVLLWDHEVAVDWADPEPGEPVDEEIMENVTALFVRNLSMNIPQQRIRDLFQRATNIPILKLKKINHFAFVHYETRELAEKAMKILTRQDGVADQELWEIRWAKPIGPIKQAERQRCINEAILQSKNKKVSKIVKSRNAKFISEENDLEEMEESIDMQYVTLLTDYVSKTLQAMCSFECLTSYNPVGFIHKVTVYRNNLLIIEDYGSVQPTRQLSLNNAVSVVYQKLKNLYDYNIYHNVNYSPVIVDDLNSQMMNLNFNKKQEPQFRNAC